LPSADSARPGDPGSQFAGASGAALRTRLILVDDDADFCAITQDELVERGFAVVGFSDGKSMLEWFADGNTADIIVLDWKMPGMTGVDVLRHARRRGIQIPVVMLTGMPELTYENVALDQGALDFVDKAKGVEILTKRLRLIVEAGKRPADLPERDSIVLGPLELRPGTSRAYWAGRDVQLTLTEFNIVRRLVGRAGEFTSYRTIYDCVHHAGFIAGRGYDGFRTNVRSSMKRIRNKFRSIDGNFGEIENFPAFGYRWRAASANAD